MKARTPPGVKPSRLKRMKELSDLEKEVRQLNEEFEDHKRVRRRLGRKAKKLASHVSRRIPDMRIDTDDEVGLHDMVSELASTIHLAERPNDHTYDDSAHRTSRIFEDLFEFIKCLSKTPWLSNPEEE